MRIRQIKKVLPLFTWEPPDKDTARKAINEAMVEARVARKVGNDIKFCLATWKIAAAYIDYIRGIDDEVFNDEDGRNSLEYWVSEFDTLISVIEELLGWDYVGELLIIATGENPEETMLKFLHNSIKE